MSVKMRGVPGPVSMRSESMKYLCTCCRSLMIQNVHLGDYAFDNIFGNVLLLEPPCSSIVCDVKLTKLK